MAGWQLSDKKILNWVAMGALVLVLAAAAIVSGALHSRLRTTDVLLGDTRVRARLADNDLAREKGLSGTHSLKSNEGMLFIFEQSGQHPFWMKDMRYNIDIIWLDENHRITHIARDVSPKTYPQLFASPTPALFVLEVPSGFSDAHHLREGSVAVFSR